MDGFSLAQALILVLALSADTFIAGFSYGAKGVRFPFASVLVVAGICGGTLALSMLLGGAAGGLIPAAVTRALGFLVLFLTGGVKLFDSSLKALLRKRPRSRKRIHFCLFSLCFILDVYADPEKADEDYSQVLSPREAAPLAAALSLDGLAAGLGAGLSTMGWGFPATLSLAVSVLAMELGGALGRRLAKRAGGLDWLGGVLLLLLAFSKLF